MMHLNIAVFLVPPLDDKYIQVMHRAARQISLLLRYRHFNFDLRGPENLHNNDNNNKFGGDLNFFSFIGLPHGLGPCVLWVRCLN